MIPVIPYLVDHCFDEDVLRALKRKSPGIDFVLARDVGLAEAEDPDVLAWAAQEGRVVMTHDYDRFRFALVGDVVGVDVVGVSVAMSSTSSIMLPSQSECQVAW